MKKEVKNVLSPQEREEKHRKEMGKFQKEIDHSEEEKVVEKEREKLKKKELLFDNKEGGVE